MLALLTIEIIIKTVFLGDQNRNFSIEANEIRIMVLRVSNFFDSEGIVMQTNKLEDIVRAHPKVEDLIKVLRIVLGSRGDDPESKGDIKYENEFITSKANTRTMAEKMINVYKNIRG